MARKGRFLAGHALPLVSHTTPSFPSSLPALGERRGEMPAIFPPRQPARGGVRAEQSPRRGLPKTIND